MADVRRHRVPVAVDAATPLLAAGDATGGTGAFDDHACDPDVPARLPGRLDLERGDR